MEGGGGGGGREGRWVGESTDRRISVWVPRWMGGEEKVNRTTVSFVITIAFLHDDGKCHQMSV